MPELTYRTTYRQRFAEALGLLCGEPAPADLIDEWLVGDEDAATRFGGLQDWVGMHIKLPWCLTITAIESAEAMAREPCDTDTWHDHDWTIPIGRAGDA